MIVDSILLAIATSHVASVATLESRHRDSLDFHDVSVASLKEMLQEAFEAGAEYQRQATNR